MIARGIRRAGALFALAAAVTAAGCDGGGTLPAGVAGNYQLVSVNGQPLPFVFPNTPDLTVTLKQGRLTLEQDGDFEQVLVSNIVTTDPGDSDPGDVVAETVGEVEVSGGTLRFRPRQETSFSGTLTEGGLSYTRSGGGQNFVFAFTRQP